MGALTAVLDVLGLQGAPLPVTSPAMPSKASKISEISGRRPAWGAALAVVAGLALGGVMSAPAGAAGAADSCANAAVRIQTGSTALPDCRAYEMVSPPFKEGFPVVTPGDFTDGGVVSYLLRGSIAGDGHGSSNNLYHAVRSATGWGTVPLGPPATVYNTSLDSDIAVPVAGESPDLRWSLWRMWRRSDGVPGLEYWVRGPDGAFAKVGSSGGLGVQGVSDDLSHLVMNQVVSGGNLATALREFVGTGNEGPPRPVSVDNAGLPTPGQSCLNDVSSDGRVIVFGSGCFGGMSALWARVGGAATVSVSGSECARSAGDAGGLCNGVSAATYEGDAADGSRVFFTTRQQLVDGDVDVADDADAEAGNDLYACDVPAGVPAPVGSANGCAALTEVSGAADDAQVESVVAISQDGSKVYFVAQGVLADNLGVGDAGPRSGAHNLYLWQRDGAHPAGQTRYVARLGQSDLGRAQMTPDGRYLLFVSANALVTAGAGADADATTPGHPDPFQDVYRYDSVTHTIVRVSTSVSGGGGDGSFDASIPGSSAMSADGSTVVFSSAEALSPSDANGVTDVYSWRDGRVSPISSGGGSPMGITGSGRDIFFITAAPVSGADRDLINDIYVARVGGGFMPRQAPRCSGDQCQGPAGGPPGLPGPAAAVPGGGSAEAAPAFSLRAVSAAQRRSLAATGRLTLTVTANAPGTIGARATASIGGRSATVASAQRALTAPGRVSVALTLSRAARARLASRGSLTVRIAVSHSRVALDRAVALRLVRAKARRSVSGGVGGRS
jgi:hypothetical protein